MEAVKQQFTKIREACIRSPLGAQLQKVEDMAHVPLEYLVVGVGAFVALLLLLGVGASLIANMVGFLYPAFCSFKAIESEDKNDDTQWLIYWVVYSTFIILESFIDILLYWVPFYYAIKVGFLFFLMRGGAKQLYDGFLRDILVHAETHVNEVVGGGVKTD
mmetsp:Transcript_3778/g.13009  ORF Transcript_3778/g.13009 Transcript_3778/m.13009 type:complete len:161 (-) Transcript_3778:103-585(-)